MELEELKKYDKNDMLGALKIFPMQIEEAAKLRADLPGITQENISNIIIAGVGGSGIGGMLLKNYLADKLEMPVICLRDYSVPLFAGKNTLAFIVSYSGDTEEALAVLQQLRLMGAYTITLSKGGQLEKESSEYYIKLPEIKQPRMAIGYLIIPILISLRKAGLLKNNLDTEIKECAETLAQLSEYLADDDNIAMKIAQALHNKIPLIYSSEKFSSTAYRFVTQINENAKQFAFFHTIPEQNHNEINAIDANKRNDLSAVFIRDLGDHARIKKRIEYFMSLMIKKGIAVHEVHARGTGLLARMFSTIYICDFISYYLALLNNVDPMPVDAITKLKQHMAE
ncbi:MAG: bifunctional phosphoglucose/phosphomannose isomerase [Candidatus Aenigmarchaeota archaeon]|nr:bifunctional phosphoglucose/phosphomannose isomerase [Candidatus Aenigmarchaeota archaeon]